MIKAKHITNFLQPERNRMLKTWVKKFTGLNDPVYLLCMLYVVSLPFLKILPVAWISLLGIIAIFGYKWKSAMVLWSNNYTSWCLLGLYLLYVINLFFTGNPDETIVKLSVKFSYLMLPLLLIPTAFFTKQQIYNLLKVFVAGTSISLFVNLFISTFHYIQSGNIACFYYDQISNFHHTSYYAFYIGFAAMAILYLMRKQQIKKKLPAIIMFFFHTAIIFMLSSKAGILAFILALSCEGLIRVIKHKNIKNIALFFGSLVIVFLIVNYNVRLNHTINNLTKNKTNNIEQRDPRLQIWKTCTMLIPMHFWTGIGAGDTTEKLIEKYREYNFQVPAQKRLNCHNQFFQTQLSTGIFASIFLMLSFLFIIINHGTKFEGIIWIFLLMVFIHFLFEAMLETQSGVQFIVFFLVLFSYQQQKFTS
ncbi:MAG: O-antigen ligase family protein [Candidatus Delongbacteria bacterium]|jgi:O-antigen ligase|nr:O-antigen ligase family protein [Candidatus Delongbacteria bacterium]